MKASDSALKGALLMPIEQTGGVLSRGRLLFGLYLIIMVNALFWPVADSITELGLSAAFADTFSVSAIVWIASLIGGSLLLTSDGETTGRDLLWALVLSLATLAPFRHFGWVLLTIFGFYLWRTAPRRSDQRSAGVIVMAISVPMLWTKLLFAAVDQWILEWDAVMVSWLTGLRRAGNTLELADGSGFIWIAGSCSSIANVSLMVLAWVALQQVRRGRQDLIATAWFAAGVAGVVALNVLRMSLVAVHPERYELYHGPTGAAVAGWLTTLMILAACYWGTGRARP